MLETTPHLLEQVGLLTVDNVSAWAATATVKLSAWPVVNPARQLVFARSYLTFQFFVPDLDEYLHAYIEARQMFAVLSVDWEKMKEFNGRQLVADHLYYFPLLNITNEVELYCFAHGSLIGDV